MLALIRIPVVAMVFIAINFAVLLLCIFRPFHRNNVYCAGQLYGLIAPLLGLSVRVRFAAHFDVNQSYVVIANHQNSYDLISICKAAFPGIVTIGKKSLVWLPIFGQIYWLSGNILIDRKNTAKALDTLLHTAKKITQRKLSVWFFPEGTRSNGQGILPFKVGAFRLAQKTDTPLVMVTASDLHNKIKWNRWNNGELLIDVEPPQHLDESHSAKAWMAIYQTKMKKKFTELNAQVAERQKSG